MMCLGLEMAGPEKLPENYGVLIILDMWKQRML